MGTEWEVLEYQTQRIATPDFFFHHTKNDGSVHPQSSMAEIPTMTRLLSVGKATYPVRRQNVILQGHLSGTKIERNAARLSIRYGDKT